MVEKEPKIEFKNMFFSFELSWLFITHLCIMSQNESMYLGDWKSSVDFIHNSKAVDRCFSFGC